MAWKQSAIFLNTFLTRKTLMKISQSPIGKGKNRENIKYTTDPVLAGKRQERISRSVARRCWKISVGKRGAFIVEGAHTVVRVTVGVSNNFLEHRFELRRYAPRNLLVVARGVGQMRPTRIGQSSEVRSRLGCSRLAGAKNAPFPYLPNVAMES
jgi:hypothetical protein